MYCKHLLAAGALLGLLAVALGAFGAHALETRLSERLLAAYRTGVNYQMYHALALLLLGSLALQRPARLLKWSGYTMLAGTVLFSGSLYTLALSGVTGFGLITPVGGLLMLAGWLLFLIAVLKMKPV